MRAKKLVALLAVAATVAAVVPVAAEQLEGGPPVFSAKTDEGQVWVSVDLARFRKGEKYVPLLIAVYNRSKTRARLTTESFKLVDSKGKEYKAPSVEKLREGYRKVELDQTMLRIYGMPIGTKLNPSRLVPSNFYPPLTPGAPTRIDVVELPFVYWTIDLIYFEMPPGFAQGEEVTLMVSPEGWKKPVSVKIKL